MALAFFALPGVPAYAELPEIRLHPLPQSVLAGSPVTLRASEDPLAPAAVSWWKDGDALPGETSRLLEIDNTGAEHQGYYRAAFRNSEGTTWTREVFLRVIDRSGRPGARDRSFVPPGFNDDVRTIVAVADGEALVGGDFNLGGGLARLTPEGALDSSFNAGGSGPNQRVRVIMPMASERLLVGGDFTEFNGRSARSIVLLDSAGQPVPSFRSDLGFDNDVLALAELPDGKLLAAGKFREVRTDAGPQAALYVCRLFADGRPDPDFASSPVDGAPVEAFAVDALGRIVVVGSFTSVGGGADAQHIARLLPDGGRDPEFTTGEVEGGVVTSVAIAPNGEIYVGGSFSKIQNVERSRFARLGPDGAIDTGYRMDADQTVRDIKTDPLGRLLVGGRFDSFGGHPFVRLVRLTASGAIDPSFEALGLDDTVRAVALDDEGRVLVGGNFERPSNRAIRLAGVSGVAEAPAIVTPPRARDAWIGERLRLRVLASGGEGLAYTWLRDGQPLAAPSSEELNLTGLDAAHAGTYSVEVANSAGLAQSPAVVVRPRQRIPGTGSKVFAPGAPTDLPPGVTTSASLVAGPSTIGTGGLAVEVEIDHPNVEDLELVLTAPDGTSVLLMPTDCMSSGYLFSTRFEDTANSSIKNADAPAAGVYRPLQPLAALQASPVEGVWTLLLRDVRPPGQGHSGTLIGWGIEFRSPVGTPSLSTYTQAFGAEDLARYSFGLAPADRLEALNFRASGGGYELEHARWANAEDVIYRYEFNTGDQPVWATIHPVVRDRQRFPDGLERVTLGLPAEGGTRLFRLQIELVGE